MMDKMPKENPPMIGVEVFVLVADSLEALARYERIFEDIQRVEVTALPKGKNEVVFTLYGTRFRLKDDNPNHRLVSSNYGNAKSMWMNIMVPDIRATYARAKEEGIIEVQPPTDVEEMGLTNAMFIDEEGYPWMLHQIHRIVSFEERCRLLEQQ